MLLQPDSELYIVPSGGGEAKRLRCNTGRMNSWHSWSPNGKWMVFSSKAFSSYTQLFLAHFDGQGNTSPPVLLANFTAADRAANIPEFVRTPPGTIQKIREQFINDHNYVRQAQTNALFDDADGAEAASRKALALNQKNADALCQLGLILAARGRIGEAVEHHRAALKIRPAFFEASFALGSELMDLGQIGEAVSHLEAGRPPPTR